jgi:4-hydroxybenzoyl-CoA thioesterase
VSFKVEIPVRFADVDAAGIVYYPRLLHICHQAFEELYQQRGPVPYHQWCQQSRLGFPTRRLEAEFHAPVQHAGPVTVEVTTSNLGNSSVCFQFVGSQRSLEDGNERTCFSAHVWKVCCLIDGFEPTPIPPDVREVLQSIEEPQ